MKNLFEAESRNELLLRLDNISADSKAVWGQMTVDQMLWHCNRFINYIKGDYEVAYKGNWFMKVFIKPMGLGNMPYPKAKGDTMAEFKADSHYNIVAEKELLKQNLQWFAAKQQQTDWPLHPLFGKFTAANWARIAYKHTDHHLRQFGA